jgi:glycerol-3-phosphate acyltransferase PlsY
MPAVLTLALVIAAAYLLGSLSPSAIAGRRRGIDVRAHGSGNPGAANVLRLFGWRPALAVLVLDAGKGALAAWAAPRVLIDAPPVDPAWLPALGGAAAVAGHLWPPWWRFRGGKGVSTALGVSLVLAPVAAAVAVAVFLAALGITRRVSVASLGGAAALALTLVATRAPAPSLTFGVGFALLAVWTHRGNIRNVLARVEPRLSTGPDSSPAASARRARRTDQSSSPGSSLR